MTSLSSLGDAGYGISSVVPFSTSTARFFVRTSDTGTVLTTSRTFDLSRGLHIGSTGGKPLDVTLHRRPSGAPRLKSVVVAVPLELAFHSSGSNVFVTVKHSHRPALTGTGSTWQTLRTETFRFRMGTDTDGVFHTGVRSSANLQAVARYYKANVTFSFKLGSSTAAKDTTTNTELISNSPVVLFASGEVPVSVPVSV
jgi:hypothetical protein